MTDTDTGRTQTPRRAGYVDGAGYLVLGVAICTVAVVVWIISASSADPAGNGATQGYAVAAVLAMIGSSALGVGVVATGVTVGLRKAVDTLGPVSGWGERPGDQP